MAEGGGAEAARWPEAIGRRIRRAHSGRGREQAASRNDWGEQQGGNWKAGEILTRSSIARLSIGPEG
jgi:hypothetical protein